jgi:hypothetical protein
MGAWATRLAVVVALTALPSLTACAPTGPTGPTLLTRQIIAILDVSGSTQQLATTFPKTLQNLLTSDPAAVDGTRLAVVVADGSSQASICTPRTVDIRSDGDSPTKRKDNLARSVNNAAQLVANQINCGLQVNTPGSDLIGSLLSADGHIKPGLDSTRVLMFSDGFQYGPDFRFGEKFLTDPSRRKNKIKELADDGLLPTAMRGSCLTVSDPAVGAVGLSVAAQNGLKQFWRLYSQRIGARYLPALSTTCDS